MFHFTEECPWDPEKNKINKTKHGVCFEEALEALKTDSSQIFEFDEEHSTDAEDRWQVLAYHAKKKLLFVIVSEQSSRAARLVSARKASRAQEEVYRGQA